MTATATATPELLEFSDLTPHLLLKNGNFLYKVPFRGGWAVLKVYYGSRSYPETLAKSLGNVVFEDQTSYMPLTRRRIELECLDLWRSRGIRVFDVYRDVEVRAPVEQCPPGGYLLLEYVDATKLDDHMRDESIPEDERFRTFRRWLVDWCRRHELAEAERETRLVHENGDTGHIMLAGDDFLWFDFEMVFRTRDRIHEYVGREIIQYLWYILRNTPHTMHDRVVEELILAYPNRHRLENAPSVFLHNPRRLMRWARRLDRFKPRSRKPTSKYNVCRRLAAALERL